MQPKQPALRGVLSELRRFMARLLAAWGTVYVFGLLPALAHADAHSQRPNIVLFLVDDMGWQDTSVAFHSQRTPLNDKYRTPHMERLAREGMKFTQAYACSVCSPTRVSLMSGANAARHRVTNWTLYANGKQGGRHPSLREPRWNIAGMSPDAATPRAFHARALPALLREAGYLTIHAGKAHFGAVDTPGADPRGIGFEVNIGGHAAGGPGSYLGQQNYSAAWRKGARVWDVPGLEAYHGKDVFLTEALTRESIKAIDRAVDTDRPFFMYMAHYAVHVPFAADKRFMQKYVDRGLGKTEAMYAALVEGMDKSLGDLLDHIEQRGLTKQTVVLFMSDNGGLSAHGRGGRPHTHNLPLSSGKGSAHEGGVRVPMLVRWPGVTQPGSTCRSPLIIEDFFPTILKIAGVQWSASQLPQKVDGRSFTALLRGEADPSRGKRPLVWHYPNWWGPRGPGIGASSAIRVGDWKLIYYHANQRYELFHLPNDIGEQKNLADREPARRKKLAEQLGAYLKQVEAQMPTDPKSGKPVPWPGG